MNPFASFIPSKQKKLDDEVAESYDATNYNQAADIAADGGKETTSSSTHRREMGAPFKLPRNTKRQKVDPLFTLLGRLDSNPEFLNVHHAVSLSTISANGGNGSSGVRHKQVCPPIRQQYRESIDNFKGDASLLYKHIHIEANFNLRPILQIDQRTGDENMTPTVPSIVSTPPSLLKAIHQFKYGHTQMFAYPWVRQRAESYEMTEMVGKHLTLSANWTASTSTVPIEGGILHNGSIAIGASSDINGVPAAGIVSISGIGGGTGGNGRGRGTGLVRSTSSALQEKLLLQAVAGAQCRLLKWQEAFHQLLQRYIASSTGGTGSGTCIDSSVPSTAFHVLGDSLLDANGNTVGRSSSNSYSDSAGIWMPPPYLSAYFYHIAATNTNSTSTPKFCSGSSHGGGAVHVHSSSEATAAGVVAEENKHHHHHNNNNNNSSSSSSSRCDKATGCLTPTPTPACLLLGVHRSTILRLHQLGAVLQLVDHSEAAAAAASMGKALAIGPTGIVLDTAATSSAGIMQRRKSGQNILLVGLHSVRIAAEVVLEMVFYMTHGNRVGGSGSSGGGGGGVTTNSQGSAYTVDVPILLCHSNFTNAMPMHIESRAIQCQYDFNNSTNEEEADVNKDGPSVEDHADSVSPVSNVVTAPVHKIQLNGTFTSALSVPSLLRLLPQLASLTTYERDKYKTTNSTSTHRKPSKSAYAYLQDVSGKLNNFNDHKGSMSRNPSDDGKKSVQFATNVGSTSTSTSSSTSSSSSSSIAPLNPMALVTAAPIALKRAVEKEEDEEGDIDASNNRSDTSGTNKKEEVHDNSGRKQDLRKELQSTRVHFGLNSTATSAASAATSNATSEPGGSGSIASDNINNTNNSNKDNDNDDNNSGVNDSGDNRRIPATGDLVRTQDWIQEQRAQGRHYCVLHFTPLSARTPQLAYATSAAHLASTTTATTTTVAEIGGGGGGGGGKHTTEDVMANEQPHEPGQGSKVDLHRGQEVIQEIRIAVAKSFNTLDPAATTTESNSKKHSSTTHSYDDVHVDVICKPYKTAALYSLPTPSGSRYETLDGGGGAAVTDNISGIDFEEEARAVLLLSEGNGDNNTTAIGASSSSSSSSSSHQQQQKQTQIPRNRNDYADEEKRGIVLEALNKYSVYVDNRAM